MKARYLAFWSPLKIDEIISTNAKNGMPIAKIFIKWAKEGS